MEYNKSQQEAISHGDGPMMVLAGPGSGKTAVITGRVQSLIEKKHISPEQILVITFSKAAALEMKERFDKLNQSSPKPVRFGTFHSVFFQILRENYHYDVNNIITTSLKRRFIEEAIRDVHLQVEDISEFVEEVEKEIGKVKCEGMDINFYYSSNCPAEVFRDIFAGYEKRLREHRQLDFDDMILRTNRLLKEQPEVLAKWQRQFRYILIDEFQDINRLQYENICMLAEPENNLFIVGDDDQSIYGFRGAKPDIMLAFPKKYKNARQVVLTSNYRSSTEILGAATRLISHNKKRYKKEVEAVRGKEEGVRITKCRNLQAENDFIAGKLLEYHEKGIDYRDMAVLFRTNMQARTLVGKLTEYNIPFYMKERLPNIFEHFIAKDMLAYLTLSQGSRERKLFLKIANRPKRYLNHDAFRTPEIDFADLYSYYHEKPWMEEYLDNFQRDLLAIRDLPPFGAIDYIRRIIGYDDFIREYAAYRGIKPDDWLLMLDDIQESARNQTTLEEWEAYIDKYKEELKEGLSKEKCNEDTVQIMTMHGAKGLEFEIVFIPDVNEGTIPYRKAVLAEDVEEERRMLYVAMTRAKTRLHMTFLKKHYHKETKPSRFLYEISPKLKRQLK